MCMKLGTVNVIKLINQYKKLRLLIVIINKIKSSYSLSHNNNNGNLLRKPPEAQIESNSFEALNNNKKDVHQLDQVFKTVHQVFKIKIIIILNDTYDIISCSLYS